MPTSSKYPKSMPPNAQIYMGLVIGGFIVGLITGFFPKCKPEILNNETARKEMEKMGWPKELTSGQRFGVYETEELDDDEGWSFTVEYNFEKDLSPIILLLGFIFFLTGFVEMGYWITIVTKMCGCCNDCCGQDQGSWPDTCCKFCKCPCGTTYVGLLMFNGTMGIILSLAQTGTHEGPSYKKKFTTGGFSDIEVDIPEGEVSYSGLIGQTIGIIMSILQILFGTWIGAFFIGPSREAWNKEMEEIKKNQQGQGGMMMMPGAMPMTMVGPPMMVGPPQPPQLDANGNLIPGQPQPMMIPGQQQQQQQPGQPMMMMMMQPMGGPGPQIPGTVASGTPVVEGGGGAKVVPI